MLDSVLRPKIQKYLDSAVKNSFLCSVSPNTISIIGCILGMISAVLIYFKFKYLAAACLFSSGVFDILDGTIARVFQKKSIAGCTIDIIFDRLVECCIILSLFLVGPIQRALVSILLLIGVVMCLTSFFIVSILSKNSSEKSFYYSPGICERGEAFVFFITMIIFPATFQLVGYIFAALMLLTAFIRTVEFLKQKMSNDFLPSSESNE